MTHHVNAEEIDTIEGQSRLRRDSQQKHPGNPRNGSRDGPVIPTPGQTDVARNIEVDAEDNNQGPNQLNAPLRGNMPPHKLRG